MPPDDNAPLSLESALSLMTVQPEENNGAAAAASDAGQNTDGSTVDTNSADTNGQSAAGAANTDTPADQGETNEGDGDQGDALPPIEAPSSWSTEEKAEWNGLSRKAQEAIARREQDNQKALRTAQNSTADSNKKAEAEVTRLKGLAAQIDNHLNEKVNELAKEFPEVKSEADLVTLAQTDPARAQLFQVKLQALQAAANVKTQAQAELNRKAGEQQTEHVAKAKEALLEAFPTWKEPEVARREATELQDYAIKAMGVPETTARATIDPVVYKLAQKAMLYDRANDAAKAAVTRTPPRTIKPGAQNTNPKLDGKENVRRSQLDKLSKTGDLEDAIGLLRAS